MSKWALKTNVNFKRKAGKTMNQAERDKYEKDTRSPTQKVQDGLRKRDEILKKEQEERKRKWEDANNGN
jgi:hypothetical protein